MVFDFPGKYELLAMHAVMAVPFTEVVAEFRVDLLLKMCENCFIGKKKIQIKKQKSARYRELKSNFAGGEHRLKLPARVRKTEETK